MNECHNNYEQNKNVVISIVSSSIGHRNDNLFSVWNRISNWLNYIFFAFTMFFFFFFNIITYVDEKATKKKCILWSNEKVERMRMGAKSKKTNVRVEQRPMSVKTSEKKKERNTKNTYRLNKNVFFSLFACFVSSFALALELGQRHFSMI